MADENGIFEIGGRLHKLPQPGRSLNVCLERGVFYRNTGPGHTAPFGPTMGPGNDPGLYQHLHFTLYTLSDRTGRSG